MHESFPLGVVVEAIDFRLVEEDCLVEHEVGHRHVLRQLPFIHEQSSRAAVEAANLAVRGEFFLDAPGKALFEEEKRSRTVLAYSARLKRRIGTRPPAP